MPMAVLGRKCQKTKTTGAQVNKKTAKYAAMLQIRQNSKTLVVT